LLSITHEQVSHLPVSIKVVFKTTATSRDILHAFFHARVLREVQWSRCTADYIGSFLFLQAIMKEPGIYRPAEVSKLRADIAVQIHDDFNEFENAATLSGTPSRNHKVSALAHSRCFHVCTGWRLDVLQLRMGEWRADWQLPIVEQKTSPLSHTVKITSRSSSMLVVGGQDEIVRTQSITLL
jgi:hypothetical protein